MTHVTCRLTARTGISSGTLRSVIEYGLPLPFLLTGGNQTGTLLSPSASTKVFGQRCRSVGLESFAANYTNFDSYVFRTLICNTSECHRCNSLEFSFQKIQSMKMEQLKLFERRRFGHTWQFCVTLRLSPATILAFSGVPCEKTKRTGLSKPEMHDYTSEVR